MNYEVSVVTILKYGNTNTCYIDGGLLVDTDYAGTLQSFYRALKNCNLQVKDIRYVLATHYHPDHMGLISELMKQGVRLLLVDTQNDYVHFSDKIFDKDKLFYEPIDETAAAVITCAKSRDFLAELGILGEIISTPSHSPDSISVILDDGCCIVGDLEPLEYLGAYDDNEPLQRDWERVLSYAPKLIIYAHANEKIL